MSLRVYPKGIEEIKECKDLPANHFYFHSSLNVVADDSLEGAYAYFLKNGCDISPRSAISVRARADEQENRRLRR